MNDTGLFRPAWTPFMVGLLVVGFLIKFWIGLVVMAYILWGNRLGGWKRDFDHSCGNMFASAWKRSCTTSRRSGNVAFDDWREAELERLAAERRKLDEMAKAFDEHMVELRRARDQEEFDRFMAERKRAKSRTDDKEQDSGAPQQA